MTIDFMRLTSYLVATASLLCFTQLLERPGRAEIKTIEEHAKMPKLNQHQNFKDIYANSPTDIPSNLGNKLTYSQLPNNTFENQIGFGNFIGNPRRKFQEESYSKIISGDLHCVPTAITMYMKWYMGTKLTKLRDLGQKDIDWIAWFAKAMDTNDLNPMMRNGDRFGHFGTIYDDALTAVNNYLNSSYPKGAGRGATEFRQ
mgnify:CR=1 FL=1